MAEISLMVINNRIGRGERHREIRAAPSHLSTDGFGNGRKLEKTIRFKLCSMDSAINGLQNVSISSNQSSSRSLLLTLVLRRSNASFLLWFTVDA
ncbi:hypothetical protein KY285_027213 [Solanum tuberosum]|nr:hypothetical protein KY289_027423 [Solanum tuberosum]KAH0666007.1 hypothetical protein KY285_027213 [Solanum tuberosum]